MKEVTIIGSGVIGICAAYYLNQAGIAVRIIDQIKAEEENCSFGNAGMIVPSHFTPLAAPGVIKKGLKWMLNSSSPFYIKPRLNRALINWIWQFHKHATAAHVAQSSRLLHDLNRISNDLYNEINQANLFEYEYKQKGLMMLYKSDKCEQEELEIAEQARAFGIKADHLTKEEVNKIQQTDLSVKGAVLYKDDAQLNPNVFMRQMRSYLSSKGVVFTWETKVQGLDIEKNKIQKIKTNKGDINVENVLITAGSWTSELAKSIGLKIPLQAGKGYSFNMNRSDNQLAVPSILCEAKVAVTPFANQMRFAGTLGIEGLNLKKNERRVAAIKNAIPNYFPAINVNEINTDNAWVGLRPCSPDGLPYIGRGKQDNLVIATGHAMMGMSLGPITGKLITEIFIDKTTSVEIDQLSPLRYSK